MSQPSWKFVTNLGDSSPLEYGGYFLYEDTTGAYGFEAELLEEPTERELDDARWTVRHVCLDRCKLQRSEDGASVYLVSHRYEPCWPHPLASYAEWFARDLDGVASAIGSTREELEEQLCSEDGALRAQAYRAIADTHGWDNFDSEPLSLTLAEVEKRYVDGELGANYRPADAVILKAEHLRQGAYSARAVFCRNAGSYGADAKPGDLIEFAYPREDGSSGQRSFARVLGRVDASSEGECKAVTAWLAVVELAMGGTCAMVRWIDPARVSRVAREIPRAMLEWFFAEKLPMLPTVLKLNGLGSLSNSYIGKYKDKCERCIVEHGLFDADRPCTHAAKVCVRCSKPFHENGKERSTHDGDGIDGIDDEADADHDPVAIEDVELPGSDE